jgi:hypothetical protein
MEDGVSCNFGCHCFIDGICPHCGETKQDYIDRLERVVFIAANHISDINSLSFSNPENLDEKSYPQCFPIFWKNYLWNKSEIKPKENTIK